MSISSISYQNVLMLQYTTKCVFTHSFLQHMVCLLQEVSSHWPRQQNHKP